MSEEIEEILYLQNYVEKYKSDEEAIIKGNILTTPAMLDYLEVKALLNYITNLQQKVEQLEKENKKLNNIIDELENTIANFIENHTESYIDWKYDREIYLAECNILQKLCDTYFDKLKELKEEK